MKSYTNKTNKISKGGAMVMRAITGKYAKAILAVFLSVALVLGLMPSLRGINSSAYADDIAADNTQQETTTEELQSDETVQADAESEDTQADDQKTDDQNTEGSQTEVDKEFAQEEAVNTDVAANTTQSVSLNSADQENGAVTTTIKIVAKSLKAAAKITKKVVEAKRYYNDQSQAQVLSGVVYIDESNSNMQPIIVGEGGLILVIKDGVEVTIDGSKWGSGNYAGIRPEGGPLTITAGCDAVSEDPEEGPDPQGTGILNVYGGPKCAGIGGNDTDGQRNASDITIYSSTVNAYGGTGGTEGGAGVGGGYKGCLSNFEMYGGTLNCYGGNDSAGLGGADNTSSATSNIYIHGGTINAQGSERGSGIGGGFKASGHDIEIYEDYVDQYDNVIPTKVTAKADKKAAGIGGGDGDATHNPHGYSIKINGGTVFAQGGRESDSSGGAGIGSANGQASEELTINGGTVEAHGRGGGAGIGAGSGANAERIRITGGKVSASADDSTGAGIGAGSELTGKDKTAGVEISGGVVIASAKEGAGIGSGKKGKKANSINISQPAGRDTYVRASSVYGSGIGAAKEGECENVSISGGDIVAESEQGAGIGSGWDKNCKNINISGGMVQAKGGYNKDKKGDACGIGCGNISAKAKKCSSIKISTALLIYADSTTPPSTLRDNNGGDLSKTDAIQRYMTLDPGTQPSVTVGKQTGIATYGADSVVTYSLTKTYVAGNDWSIRWFKDAEGTEECDEPQGVSTEFASNTCTVYSNNEVDAGTYYFKVKCAGVESAVSSYTVNQAKVTITSDSASKIVDGTPLTCESATAVGFVNGDDIDYSDWNSIATVAQSPAQNTFSITGKQGTNLDNYSFTYNYGTLTILPDTDYFSVNGENYFGKYDGNDHEFSARVVGKNGVEFTGYVEFKYATSDTGAQGTWSAWSEEVPTYKDVTTKYVKAQASSVVDGKTVTIESSVYTMSITQRDVVLTSGTAEKEYDGTALTNDYVDVSGDGFVDGEGAEYNVEGKVTYVSPTGSSTPNTFDYTLNEGTNANNYNIKQAYGELNITPKSMPITITTPSVTKTYDGNAINVGTPTYTDGVLIGGDSLTITLARTGDNAVKDAGTYHNDVASYVVESEQGQNITNCYTFTDVCSGNLTINKRSITLTSGSAWKVYDGNPLTNTDVTVDGKLVEGEDLDYSDFASVTELTPEPVNNTFKYAAAEGSNFNENNYGVSVAYGKLFVVSEISLLASDQVFTYDGTPHQAKAELVGGSEAEGKVEYSTSTDLQTWSSWTETVPTIKDAGKLYIKAKGTKGGQTTKEYEYSATVNPRNVNIATSSASKNYDGTALTANDPATDVIVSGEGFVAGETYSVNITGSQTDVGSSLNEFEITFGGTAKPANYSIKKNPGTLSVSKNAAVITIYTASDSQTYNGLPLQRSNYSAMWNGDYVEDGKLCNDDVLTVTPYGAITEVGTTSNPCTFSVMRDGKDVTDYYTFATPVYGTLQVTPRNVVINTASDTKAYDGSALTNNKFTLSGDGFIEGQGIDVIVEGTRTTAGSADNNARYSFKQGTSPENYNVTVNAGTLTVEKRTVTVTSGSNVVTADTAKTTPATNSEVKVSGDGFVAGEMTENYPKAIGSQQDIGESPNYVEYQWAGNGNPANYQITENLGRLVVVDDGTVPTGIVEGYNGVYDGQEHSGYVTPKDSTAEVTYSEDGQTGWSATSPKYKEVGEYKVYAKISKGTDSAISTFYVNITKRYVDITSTSVSKIYDGTPLKGSESDVLGTDGFVSGDLIKVTMTGSQTAVGESANTFEVTLKEGVAQNYDINSTSIGKLTVDKRPVTVTTGSAVATESVAAVTPVVNPNVVVSDNGFVAGEMEQDYPKATGSQSEVGQSKNTVEYKWADGATADNYTITENLGTLKVVEDDKATVVATGYTGKYDGQEHGGSVQTTIEGATIEFSTDGQTWSKTEPKAKNVTDSKKVYVKATKDESVATASYNLTITQRNITFTSPSKEKTYDGEALSFESGDITTSGDGFVKDEGYEFKDFASITDAGSKDATFEASASEGTISDNYNVDKVKGTLTVNKRPVTVTSGSAIVTKDAVPATNEECTVTSGSFVDGEMAQDYPKGIGSQSVVGESQNTIEYKWTGAGKEDNYDITEIFGRLVVVEDSGSAVVATDYIGTYDGQDHNGQVVTTVEGATITYSVDGGSYTKDVPSFTNVKRDQQTGWIDSYKVDVKVTKGANVATAEYYVTIYPRNLELTAGSATKVYDGKELTCADYTVGGEGFAGDEQPEIKMTSTSKIENCGSAYNVISELSDDSQKGFKVSNYNISYSNGSLKVTKRPVILLSKSLGFTEDELIAMGINPEIAQVIATGHKEYTGTAYDRKEIIEVGNPDHGGFKKIDGMGFVDGQGLDYSNFAQATDAGTYSNTFDYSIKGGTNPDNYTIKNIYGLIKVVPRDVTIKSGSAEKPYDGSPLTCDSYEVTSGSFVGSEGLDCTYTGSQTLVGESTNTFTYKVDSNTKDCNYNITAEEGTLKVVGSDKLVLNVPEDQEYTFDGQLHGKGASATKDGKKYTGNIWYSTDGGLNYNNCWPQLVNAGTLNVKCYVEEYGYARSEGEYTLSVVAAEPKPGEETLIVDVNQQDLEDAAKEYADQYPELKGNGIVCWIEGVAKQTEGTDDMAKLQQAAPNKNFKWANVKLYFSAWDENGNPAKVGEITFDKLDIGDMNSVPIHITYNSQLQGKTGIGCMRVHNGEVATLPQGEEAAVEGEYWQMVDSSQEKVMVAASKYSTYAVAYDKTGGGDTPGDNPGDKSGNSGASGTSTTGDNTAPIAGVLAMLAMCSAGAVLFLRRRKQN